MYVYEYSDSIRLISPEKRLDSRHEAGPPKIIHLNRYKGTISCKAIEPVKLYILHLDGLHICLCCKAERPVLYILIVVCANAFVFISSSLRAILPKAVRIFQHRTLAEVEKDPDPWIIVDDELLKRPLFDAHYS